MGNRALIIMDKPTEDKPIVPAIYVHWNGGIESIIGVCKVCKERGFRDPAGDYSYAMARMIGVWHEFFGLDNTLSLGVMTYDGKGDAGDNGVYLIGADWEVIEHFEHDWKNPEVIHKLPKTIDPDDDYQNEMANEFPVFMKGLLERWQEARREYAKE